MRILKSAAAAALAASLAAAVAVGPAAASAADPKPGDLEITRVNYNAVGADTAANRWQEAIYLKNASGAELDISGWVVHDTYKNAEGKHTNAYTFPDNTVVAKDGLVVVSSANGIDKTSQNATQVYYMDFKRGYNGHWLNNGGDTVYAKAGDTEVAKFVYDFDNGYYVR